MLNASSNRKWKQVALAIGLCLSHNGDARDVCFQAPIALLEVPELVLLPICQQTNSVILNASGAPNCVSGSNDEEQRRQEKRGMAYAHVLANWFHRYNDTLRELMGGMSDSRSNFLANAPRCGKEGMQGILGRAMRADMPGGRCPGKLRHVYGAIDQASRSMLQHNPQASRYLQMIAQNLEAKTIPDGIDRLYFDNRGQMQVRCIDDMQMTMAREMVTSSSIQAITQGYVGERRMGLLRLREMESFGGFHEMTQRFQALFGADSILTQVDRGAARRQAREAAQGMAQEFRTRASELETSGQHVCEGGAATYEAIRRIPEILPTGRWLGELVIGDQIQTDRQGNADAESIARIRVNPAQCRQLQSVMASYVEFYRQVEATARDGARRHEDGHAQRDRTVGSIQRASAALSEQIRSQLASWVPEDNADRTLSLANAAGARCEELARELEDGLCETQDLAEDTALVDAAYDRFRVIPCDSVSCIGSLREPARPALPTFGYVFELDQRRTELDALNDNYCAREQARLEDVCHVRDSTDLAALRECVSRRDIGVNSDCGRGEGRGTIRCSFQSVVDSAPESVRTAAAVNPSGRDFDVTEYSNSWAFTKGVAPGTIGQPVNTRVASSAVNYSNLQAAMNPMASLPAAEFVGGGVLPRPTASDSIVTAAEPTADPIYDALPLPQKIQANQEALAARGLSDEIQRRINQLQGEIASTEMAARALNPERVASRASDGSTGGGEVNRGPASYTGGALGGGSSGYSIPPAVSDLRPSQVQSMPVTGSEGEAFRNAVTAASQASAQASAGAPHLTLAASEGAAASEVVHLPTPAGVRDIEGYLRSLAAGERRDLLGKVVSINGQLWRVEKIEDTQGVRIVAQQVEEQAVRDSLANFQRASYAHFLSQLPQMAGLQR